ncbi:TPA: chromosome partitioning protein ParB, partial [Legionella pneumophila]|nr:chromosome partitioning protein ParB [Legionella pneumophila]
LQASPEIKQAIAEGKIENVKLIELIISVENAEHQQVLLKAAIENLSFDAIVKLKKELEFSLVTKKEIRGRKQLNVSLGKVKPNIAKIIFDALVSSNILHESIVEQMNMLSNNVQWNNGKSVEECFKKIIPLIAQEV